eukprot:260506_1
MRAAARSLANVEFDQPEILPCCGGCHVHSGSDLCAHLHVSHVLHRFHFVSSGKTFPNFVDTRNISNGGWLYDELSGRAWLGSSRSHSHIPPLRLRGATLASHRLDTVTRLIRAALR